MMMARPVASWFETRGVAALLTMGVWMSSPSVVMPGLVPGIHVFASSKKNVDGRDKPGHDEAPSISKDEHAHNSTIMPSLAAV